MGRLKALQIKHSCSSPQSNHNTKQTNKCKGSGCALLMHISQPQFSHNKSHPCRQCQRTTCTVRSRLLTTSYLIQRDTKPSTEGGGRRERSRRENSRHRTGANMEYRSTGGSKKCLLSKTPCLNSRGLVCIPRSSLCL